MRKISQPTYEYSVDSFTVPISTEPIRDEHGRVIIAPPTYDFAVMILTIRYSPEDGDFESFVIGGI